MSEDESSSGEREEVEKEWWSCVMVWNCEAIRMVRRCRRLPHLYGDGTEFTGDFVEGFSPTGEIKIKVFSIGLVCS